MMLQVRPSSARSSFSWEKFDGLTMPEPNSGCLIWLGGVNDTGYGVIWKDGKHQKAHRLSYERRYGPIPGNAPLLHRCDTPACIEPTHLKPGTLSENFKDMWRKGRGRKQHGELGNSCLLTEAQVRMIFADLRCAPDIAREYGVAPTTIHAIRHGRTWRHLNLSGETRDAAQTS